MWRILVALGGLLVAAGLVSLALGAAIFVSNFGNALIATGAVSVSGGIVVICIALVLKEVARLNARFDALEGHDLPAGTAPLALADEHAEREAHEADFTPLGDYEPPAQLREPASRARLPFGDGVPADQRRGRVLDRPQDRAEEPVPERVALERAGMERALDRSLERAVEQMPERAERPGFDRPPAARNPLDRPPPERAPQERVPQERGPQERPAERNPLDRNPLDRNPFERIPADRMPLGGAQDQLLPERAPPERAPQPRPPQDRPPQDRAAGERVAPPRPPQDRPARPRIGSDLLPERVMPERAPERPADLPPPEPPAAPAMPVPNRPYGAPPARRTEMPEPTVLKSGIVGGMAYTLYSDGSIQAELPDGVLRFSSLQELRDHVSKTPPAN